MLAALLLNRGRVVSRQDVDAALTGGAAADILAAQRRSPSVDSGIDTANAVPRPSSALRMTARLLS
jgi:hypothetical protein